MSSNVDLSRFCFNKNRKVSATRITDDDTDEYCQKRSSRKPVILESDDNEDDDKEANNGPNCGDEHSRSSADTLRKEEHEESNVLYGNMNDDDLGLLLEDSTFNPDELQRNIVQLTEQFPDVDEIEIQDVLIESKNKFDKAASKIRSKFGSSRVTGKENQGRNTGRWITMPNGDNESLSSKPRQSRIKRRMISSDDSDDDDVVVVSSRFKSDVKSNYGTRQTSRKKPLKRVRTVRLSDSSDSEKGQDDEVEEISDDGEEEEERVEYEEEDFLASSSDEEEIKLNDDDSNQQAFKPPVSLEEEEDYEDIVGESSDDEEVEAISSVVDTAKQTLRAKILSFLQDSTENDLLSIPNVSKKKAQQLMKLRPIANWMDLVTKVKCDRLLSVDVLDDCKETVRSHEAISRLMTECERISEKMGQTVDKLETLKQPEILNRDYQLANYQLIGLNWLVLLHKRNINGILADEMGLGKTIQVIALLAHLRENLNIRGPHLIVVPSSTLDNWKREFEVWCSKVRVVTYYGSQDERALLREDIGRKRLKFDALLTTYNLVGSPSDKKFLQRIMFNYVVFDEAHMLKNMKSNRFNNLIGIRAKHRLLLTGTPVQNNLLELMSLLFFTMPSFFSSKLTHIQNLFASKSRREGETTFEKERVEQAKRILRPFVLRRLKADVLKQLPTKTEHVKLCPMTNEQELNYMNLIENYTRELRYSGKNIFESEDFDDTGTKLKRGTGMLMELRLAANHPLLLRRHFTDDKLMEMAKLMLNEPTHSDANVDYIFEDMQVMTDFELHRLCCRYKSVADFKLKPELILESGKFKAMDELLPQFKKQNQRVLIFSQFTMMLDVMEEYLSMRRHKYLRLDGQTKVSDRLNLIDQFTDDNGIFVFLLSTKAGGLGINLTSANVVILHDIDFNPYNDKQAEDRCHRMGQDRTVEIYRLISENSVEEGMLRIGEEKLKLGEDVYHKNPKAPSRDDPKDLKTLLRKTLGL